jgi:transcriptional regulator with XRE-family HTH domain
MITKKERQLREILSANIKKRRAILGISQEKLAELAGLSLQTINGIESHRLWLSDKTMIKISEALQIEVFELFFPEFDPKSVSPEHLPIETMVKLQQDLQQALNESVKATVNASFLQVYRSGK